MSDVPSHALPWLIVVARNTMANQRRSAHRQARMVDELALVERAARTAASAATTVEERTSMLRALSQLSRTEREALLLVAWDGLSPAEAGRVCGCSTATFSVRLHRARRHLERALAAESRHGADRHAHPSTLVTRQESPC